MEKDDVIRIGAVVSEFNYDITMMMLERAKEHAEFLGAKITKVIEVPGVFDMGLAIKKLLERKDIDGVVTLGAVIEGETEHDEIVIQHAARKIADLSLEYDNTRHYWTRNDKIASGGEDRKGKICSRSSGKTL